jgi:hypothetical protein
MMTVCPTCKGSKWVRGLVGGVYECPDCWTYAQIDQADKEIVAKPKRKYNRKVLKPVFNHDERICNGQENES